MAKFSICVQIVPAKEWYTFKYTYFPPMKLNAMSNEHIICITTFTIIRSSLQVGKVQRSTHGTLYTRKLHNFEFEEVIRFV